MEMKGVAFLTILVVGASLLQSTYGYEPYSMGRISYYEREPAFQSYRKRMSEDPYRQIQQTEMAPRIIVDPSGYSQLQQEVIDEITPLIQRADFYRDRDFEPALNLVVEPDPAAAAAAEAAAVIPELDPDAAAFMEYLAANEQQWPETAVQEIPPVDEYDYDPELEAGTPVKKSPLFALLSQPVLTTTSATTVKPAIQTTATSTIQVEAKTTSEPKEIQTTTVQSTKVTEISTEAVQPTENSESQVQSSVIEAVKRFLLERHHQDLMEHQQHSRLEKRFVTEKKDLLKQKSNLDKHL